MTRKHFVHAAQHIACCIREGTLGRAAMVEICCNLFSTFNPRFDAEKFLRYIAQHDERAHSRQPNAR